ncbi:MAG TPA: SusC/RagA family TonB-linked outer membrane protein [Cyclobacteriaceae bacterium]|nr:SusC/RagA family TonB-linked outer membrane protein [Cyclobacteriaceae bacterium]
MRKILQWRSVLTVLLALTAGLAFAQDRTVSGRITSADDGSGLPGVNVVVKGTSNGTVTDADGNYKLSLSTTNPTLTFSFIGLLTQEIAVGERNIVDVSMTSDVTQLSEIVVTGQAIEKDQKAIGYANQNVQGNQLSQRSEINVLNTLQGKVAGVNIVGASGAAGASTSIMIRGVTSFGNTSNQPLIVVDGIIFNNSVDGGTSVFTSQPTNRLNDIAPENIESINILKGPAAAALYGSRAGAGAIVITTKSGKRLNGKTEVTLTSSVTTQNAYGLPKFQNQYGQGTNNDFINNSTNSWGPAFDGGPETVQTLQGNTVPYQAYPDNVQDFFKTGRVLSNGVSIMSGNADNNVSLSVNSSLTDGIVPNSSFDRNSFQFGGSSKMKSGFSLASSMTYVHTKQVANPQGNGGSALGQMTRIPRSYDLLGMPFEDANGKSLFLSTTQNHPLWSTKNEVSTSNLDRVFGFVKAAYNITDWLNVTYRVTGDVYNDRRKIVYQIGSNRNATGRITEDIYYASEFNGDLMINASKDNLFIEGFNANLLLGHNINQRQTQNAYVDGQTMAIPFFTNVSNTSVFTSSGESKSLRRLIGYYGQLSVSYKNWAFLEMTARGDQSSTLPAANNLYFYPAVSASVVLSDALGIQSDILSSLKLRASAAKVGKDASTYLLNSLYVSSGYGNNVASVSFPIAIGGSQIGFTPSTRIGNQNLTPEFVKSYDGAVVVGLFKNRINLDLGYFYTRSENQIFNVAVSYTSGFATQTTNIGLMTNKGIEAVLNAQVLRIGDFSWDISANYTRIRNKVVQLTPDDIENENSAIPGNSNFVGMIPSLWEGQPFGVVVGSAMTRNDNGDLLVNPNTGAYVAATGGKIIANPQPNFLLGVTNTFSYKGIVLSALFDTRQGGQFLSFGNIDLRTGGSLEQTAVAREMPRILPGVIDNGDGTFRPNNIQISSQAYWGGATGLGGLGSESGIFDATVYRFRELSLSYGLPKKWYQGTPITSINLGISGRNLWFFAPGSPSDPEVNTQGAANGGGTQGIDQNGAPNTRNFGANLRVVF